MLLAPYRVDVTISRFPVTNLTIICVTILVQLLIMSGNETAEAFAPYMILHWTNPLGIPAHVLLHGGVLHLAGNMLFLWVFGNAVCSKVGNLAFVGCYILLACVAAVAHLLFDGTPAAGASGAINGIVGMYVVFYPRNDVSCFYWFLVKIGTFRISGVWIILLWLTFDIWGAFSGRGSVAYWAHIGGFAGGFVLAITLIHRGLVTVRPTEETLFHLGEGNRSAIRR